MGKRNALPTESCSTGINHVVGRAIAVAAIAVCIIGTPVFAADPDSPDTLSVVDVIACRDLQEEDDLLVAVHYNIDYSVTGEPSQTAQELFIIRLFSSDGSTLHGAVQPYPFYNDGYSQGVAGLYFPAADGLVWNTAYIVQIAGNPAHYASPPSVNHALDGGDYSGFDGQEDNRAALYQWVIDSAEDLESNWTATLLEHTDVGTILDETGQTYYAGAIPGLQALCPQCFYIEALTVDYTERDWGTDQADEYAARYDDTFIGDGMDAIADLFEVEAQLLGGILFVLFPTVFLIIMSFRWFSDSTPALIGAPCIMAMGALMGFFSMGVFAVAGLCYAIFIAYVLFFRTS